MDRDTLSVCGDEIRLYWRGLFSFRVGLFLWKWKRDLRLVVIHSLAAITAGGLRSIRPQVTVTISSGTNAQVVLGKAGICRGLHTARIGFGA